MNEVIYRKSVLLPACTAVFCRFLKPSLEWLYQSGVPEPCCFVLFFRSYRGNGTMYSPREKTLSLFAGADRTASWTISKLGNWGWAAVYQLFFHFTRYKGLDPEPSDSNVGLKKHMILCKSIFVRIPIVYTNSGNPKERHVENFGTFYLSSWGIFERKICCSERSLCSFGTVQSGWSSPSPPLRRLKLISLVLGHGFLRVISYVWRFP